MPRWMKGAVALLPTSRDGDGAVPGVDRRMIAAGGSGARGACCGRLPMGKTASSRARLIKTRARFQTGAARGSGLTMGPLH